MTTPVDAVRVAVVVVDAVRFVDGVLDLAAHAVVPVMGHTYTVRASLTVTRDEVT